MPKRVKWSAVAIIMVASIAIGICLLTYGKNVYAVNESIATTPADCPGDMRFAVIGDFGLAGPPEADVAALVDSWGVDLVVTVGDNNYPNGAAHTIDANIGQYYSRYIFPYAGDFGRGAETNRFFPALGNHDLRTDAGQPYFDYFELPGNERYYDFVRGSVHFLVLNSDKREPDGRAADSAQARWLQSQMMASAAPWQLVVLHHPPYSSSVHRKPDPELQWPFAEWGATAVLSGHDHTYERLHADGIPYIVNGLGGKSLYRIGRPVPESVVRYNKDYGAMLVSASESCINFSFYSRAHELIDTYTLVKEP
jgi:tartrate-resistant acid phosphatase type 5